jgi:hypothetical protein
VLGDGDIKALVFNCRMLCDLDLSYCYRISDDSLREMSGRFGLDLTSLDLSGADGVTSR